MSLKTTILSAAGLITCFTFNVLAGGEMSFFVTSASVGQGGNLGGLKGADDHCQKLAIAVGAGGKTWRAYLSTGKVGNVHCVRFRGRFRGQYTY